MTEYNPLYVKDYQTGLVQSRQDFILPEDAFPNLENAFVWRERIKRKQGCQTLGRLRRVFTGEPLGNTIGAQTTYTFNTVFTFFAIGAGEPNKQLEPGSVVITIAAPDTATFTDNGQGGFTATGAGVSGSINYATGAISFTLSASAGGSAMMIAFNYFPALPVMGLRLRELNAINFEQTIAFDQIYAYRFGSTGWQEFVPGTTWTGTDYEFFWTTNYWVTNGNVKAFWATNFSGTSGDPIRYTNGVQWIDFAPTINVPKVGPAIKLTQCLAMLPFRGRLVVFNTLEGENLATSTAYFQRIRWAAIGNPFSDVSAIVTTVNANAWRDDIRGQGGFLDIPTSENIVAVGFVRDNLVIYCERSTWQLRYTGRTIAPFQIEKVNTELGAESTFSAVQFDTSLVGIGDKGIVECDSFKSERIDIKIPDLVFEFNNDSEGPSRVHGVRDFQQRLAFWTYPYKAAQNFGEVYPNRRLVYNYENDSWAIFTDSLTTLGIYQSPVGRTWANTKKPWEACNFQWVDRESLFPSIIGGNQQGYVVYLDVATTNDPTLAISNITGNAPTVTVINSPKHNLDSEQTEQPYTVIEISGINIGSDFADLNGKVFAAVPIDADNFQIYSFDPATGDFTAPNIHAAGVYTGHGEITIRDNFSIVSKKFNFADQGQNIQIGYVDVLMDATASGAVSFVMYLDYANESPSNTLPNNQNPDTLLPDTFFNSVIPTNATDLGVTEASKYWHRVFCQSRANFLTMEYKFSPAQMAGNEQKQNVQIDAQVIWQRPAGRMTF